MAECFLVQNGGGNSLNFKVVGNPQPASPKENTIWIDTDVDITSYAFSATEPTNHVPGMVWFSIDTSSAAEFNALKKNAIQVYPKTGKQYISDAWHGITYSIYKNDGWVEMLPELVLFDGENGGDNTAVTGGLTAFGSCTISTDKINLSSNTASGAGFTTNNSLDLSQYTTLVIYGEIFEDLVDAYGMRYGITSSKISSGVWGNQFHNFSDAIMPPKSTEPVLVPITAANGYIAACGVGTTTITKIVLR